ncbi:hypothetical protein OHT52_11205 [Streptomyces sp. NBC_00247]|uniref:hypothetical protein n=1 Tax=Streptomyces sp. NBC_00247 TaxID=2975689 RepID=UPI002E2E54BD|nr:hypothetical protein [Streptomyces sp. NBC_00247]
MFPNTTTRPPVGPAAPYPDSAAGPARTAPAQAAPGWARPGGTARLPSPVPPRCAVPDFPPLRVRGGGGTLRLRRALYGRQRALAAGFALVAAALAASGLGAAQGRAASAAGPERARPPVRLVSAPVRITDAATVRLLRPGDRVDVISAPASGDGARVVARDVRVRRVPGAHGPGTARADWPPPSGGEDPGGGYPGGGDPGGGALVMLSVTRETAVALAGAHASGELLVAVSDA